MGICFCKLLNRITLLPFIHIHSTKIRIQTQHSLKKAKLIFIMREYISVVCSANSKENKSIGVTLVALRLYTVDSRHTLAAGGKNITVTRTTSTMNPGFYAYNTSPVTLLSELLFSKEIHSTQLEEFREAAMFCCYL